MDSDFQGTSGTLVFEDGQASASVTILTKDDSQYERPEQFTFRLSSPDGALLLAPSTLTVNLRDNDLPQPGKVQFSTSTLTVQESDGIALLPLERVGGSDESISVSFACTAGSALAGFDFEPVSGRLTLHDGEAGSSLAIPLVDDWLSEKPETFTVTLIGSDTGERSVITVMIEDADSKSIDAQRGTFTGLIRAPSADGAGRILKIVLGAHRMLTGTLDLGTQRYGFRGALDARGHVALSMPRRGQAPLRLELQLAALSGGDRFTGTLAIDGLTSPISAGTTQVASVRHPAAAAGSYNLVLETAASEDAPPGAGWVRLSGRKGRARR